jgi:hypothetical protein
LHDSADAFGVAHVEGDFGEVPDVAETASDQIVTRAQGKQGDSRALQGT